ncbi:uncharacterized protein N7458_011844 [Penicillium daleae]|uniref:Uncharacterized protein n=1 Tax=Penicillium daleae TaxID=63821 RepID=A0AAD6FWS6_9EURO|nr:uncharacterized protein N7458_011844 [Penicillium daleae]KAJ5432688.1 hypothetical protein N7458_011844 [Penicillium daleae]
MDECTAHRGRTTDDNTKVGNFEEEEEEEEAAAGGRVGKEGGDREREEVLRHLSGRDSPVQ